VRTTGAENAAQQILDFKLAPQNYERKIEKTTFEAVITKLDVKIKPNTCMFAISNILFIYLLFIHRNSGCNSASIRYL